MFKFISLSHWKKFQCENLPLPVSREDLEGATSSTPSISNFVRSEIRLTKNISIIKRRIYFYTKFNFKFHCSPLCVREVRTRIRLEKMCGNYFRCLYENFNSIFTKKKCATQISTLRTPESAVSWHWRSNCWELRVALIWNDLENYESWKYISGGFDRKIKEKKINNTKYPHLTESRKTSKIFIFSTT